MFHSNVGCKGCGRKSRKGKLREVFGEVSLLDTDNRKNQELTPQAANLSLCQSCYLKIHNKYLTNLGIFSLVCLVFSLSATSQHFQHSPSCILIKTFKQLGGSYNRKSISRKLKASAHGSLGLPDEC